MREIHPRTPDRQVRGDVVIIGMAGLFPGAPDLTRYWQNILDRVDAISDPPAGSWDPTISYDPDSSENDRLYCKRGGYLAPVAQFDPIEHGVMPRAIDGAEPDQWLALKVARAALLDAGYLHRIEARERTAVVIGKGNYVNRGNFSMVEHAVVVDQMLETLRALHPEFSPEDLARIRAELKSSLPPFNTETAMGLIPNVTAGRIANRLDLMGPSYTVDAACASSLIAAQIAMQDLLTGECDLALVGGAHITTSVPIFSLFCQLNALSRRQQIRPFDVGADGTILGEGVGMVVLKRREDAERDGDRIYAVLRGVGSSSDGRGVSLMAPRLEGEELALRRAYDAAGIDPASLELIEAHGTATTTGDHTEIEALTRVFGQRERVARRCAIGTVKSMIGHTMPASGIAGLIKTALALYHRVLPPTLNVTDPIAALQTDSTPFYVNTASRPWIHGNLRAPRRAGVNAFGFGGINAHAILEEAHHPNEELLTTHQQEWDSEAVILRAESPEALVEVADQMLGFLARAPEVKLKDLAYTLNRERTAGIARLGIVATSLADLRAKLQKARDRLADPKLKQIKDVSGIYYFSRPLAREGKVAVLFPGEGAQYPNMLADLCVHLPRVRASFDQMDRAFGDHPRGFVTSDFVFPPPLLPAPEKEFLERQLWQSDGAYEAILTANQALWSLVRELGLRPDVVVGHSTGEYSAMRAAGVLDLEDDAELFRFVQHLNRGYAEAIADNQVPRAALLAIGADRDTVAALAARAGGHLFVAMDNCVHQAVIVGEPGAVDRALEIVKGEGLIYEYLTFDRAYHTPLYAPYLDHLRSAYAEARIAPARVPIYSCTTAAPYPDDPAEIRHLMLEHWVAPVEFRQTIERLHADGVRLFFEVGPRGNLTTFVEDILRGRPYAAIPINVQRRTGITQLNHALAALSAHGAELDFGPLYRRRDPAEVDWRGEAPERASRPALLLATDYPSFHFSDALAAELRGRPSEPAAAASKGAGTSDHEVETHSRGPLSWPELDRPTAESAPSLAVTHAAPAADQTTSGESQPGGEPFGIELAAAGVSDPTQNGHFATLGEIGAPVEGLETAMTAFLDTMNQFLAIQQDVMGAFLGTTESSSLPSAHVVELNGWMDLTGTTATQPAPVGRATLDSYPLLGEIVSHQPGVELITQRCFDPEEDLYLRDHTLGREISKIDPTLMAMAMVPLTMTLELLGEAAAALVPDQVVVGLQEVRAYRWIAFDGGPQVLQTTARRLDGDDCRVRVSVRNLTEDEQIEEPAKSPVAEAVVILAPTYPAQTAGPRPALQNLRTSRWRPERLYREAMFHGPTWQAVEELERTADDGAVALLRVLPFGAMFQSDSLPSFVFDPIILDAAGQVPGFWTQEHLAEGNVLFPFRMDALEVYGPPRPAGELTTCVASIRERSELQIRWDIDVYDRDGMLWMRLLGWADKRFFLPPRFYQMLLTLEDAELSTPWTEPLAPLSTPGHPIVVGRGPIVCRRLTARFPSDRGFWKRVWSNAILSRREREAFAQLRTPEPRQIAWLAGRMAAKEAVRDLLREVYGLVLPPADIEIIADENGCPIVAGAWRDAVARVPVVSIGHTDDTAVALAALPDARDDGGAQPPLLGIDVEHLRRVEFGFAEIAFTEAEHALLQRLGRVDRGEWTLRFWCAKEALAKAVGLGLVEGPRSVEVCSANIDTGVIQAALRGILAAKFSGLAGRPVIVYTVRADDLIAAVTFCEQTGAP